jgi:hypothetical protein
MYPAQVVAERVDITDALLEQVAHPSSRLSEEFNGVPTLQVLREDHNGQGRVALANIQRRP